MMAGSNSLVKFLTGIIGILLWLVGKILESYHRPDGTQRVATGKNREGPPASKVVLA